MTRAIDSPYIWLKQEHTLENRQREKIPSTEREHIIKFLQESESAWKNIGKLEYSHKCKFWTDRKKIDRSLWYNLLAKVNTEAKRNFATNSD